MSKVFKKTFIVILNLLIIFANFAVFPTPVSALQITPVCTGDFTGYATSADYKQTQALDSPFNIVVNFGSNADRGYRYHVKLTNFGQQLGPFNTGNEDVRSVVNQIGADGSITFQFPGTVNKATRTGNYRATLIHNEAYTLGQEAPSLFNETAANNVCELGNINFFDPQLQSAQCNMTMANHVQQDLPFSVEIEKNDPTGVEFYLHFFKEADLNVSSIPAGLTYIESPLIGSPTQSILNKNSVLSKKVDPNTSSAGPSGIGHITVAYTNTGGERLQGGPYIALLEVRKYLGRYVRPAIAPPLILPGVVVPQPDVLDKWDVFYCSTHPFSVTNEPTPPITEWTPGTIVTQPGQGGTLGGGEIKSETCLQRKAKDSSVTCTESGGTNFECGTDGIKTAIGCIHTKPVALVKDLLTFLIGISGGIAFLLMLLGAFGMITSAGNPDALKEGQDRFVKALEGLLFVIFAVLLLKVIGVDILGLGNFFK